jgi:tungstate transport system permease protein
MTVFFSAFGRCIAEVGAIMLVGGNIRGQTRTMTTAIVLETSKGEFALAMALGVVLLSLTVGLSASAFWLSRRVSGVRLAES